MTFLDSIITQNSESGLVVEQSSHGNSLLFTTRKDIVPVIDGIETSFSFNEVVKIDFLENLLNVFIRNSLSEHLKLGVGIDDLVSEVSRRQVGSLFERNQLRSNLNKSIT